MLAKTILKRILHFRSQTMKYPQPLAALSSAFLLTVLLAGCSTPPWGGTAKPEGMPLVILDTDIGSSTDDLFALEMLFRYEEAGKCRLLGVVVDRPGEAENADDLHAEITAHLPKKDLTGTVAMLTYVTPSVKELAAAL